MSNKEVPDIQLCLFPARLVWQEFPQDVRMHVSQLLAVMCVEIVEELYTSQKETQNESRSHSSLAP